MPAGTSTFHDRVFCRYDSSESSCVFSDHRLMLTSASLEVLGIRAEAEEIDRIIAVPMRIRA